MYRSVYSDMQRDLERGGSDSLPGIEKKSDRVLDNPWQGEKRGAPDGRGGGERYSDAQGGSYDDTQREREGLGSPGRALERSESASLSMGLADKLMALAAGAVGTPEPGAGSPKEGTPQSRQRTRGALGSGSSRGGGRGRGRHQARFSQALAESLGRAHGALGVSGVGHQPQSAEGPPPKRHKGQGPRKGEAEGGEEGCLGDGAPAVHRRSTRGRGPGSRGRGRGGASAGRGEGATLASLITAGAASGTPGGARAGARAAPARGGAGVGAGPGVGAGFDAENRMSPPGASASMRKSPSGGAKKSPSGAGVRKSPGSTASAAAAIRGLLAIEAAVAAKSLLCLSPGRVTGSLAASTHSNTMNSTTDGVVHANSSDAAGDVFADLSADLRAGASPIPGPAPAARGSPIEGRHAFGALGESLLVHPSGQGPMGLGSHASAGAGAGSALGVPQRGPGPGKGSAKSRKSSSSPSLAPPGTPGVCLGLCTAAAAGSDGAGAGSGLQPMVCNCSALVTQQVLPQTQGKQGRGRQASGAPQGDAGAAGGGKVCAHLTV